MNAVRFDFWMVFDVSVVPNALTVLLLMYLMRVLDLMMDCCYLPDCE